MREEPLQDLQQDLVGHVEQVRYPSRQQVGDKRHLDVALVRPDVGRHHRADRRERRVNRAQLLVLVEDLDELAEMSVPPVPSRALSLLQDLVYRALRAGQVGHRDQLRPAEVLGGRLRARRADE